MAEHAHRITFYYRIHQGLNIVGALGLNKFIFGDPFEGQDGEYLDIQGHIREASDDEE